MISLRFDIQGPTPLSSFPMGFNTLESRDMMCFVVSEEWTLTVKNLCTPYIFKQGHVHSNEREKEGLN